MIPQDTLERKARYRVPLRLAGGLVWAALTLRQRSFAQDARLAVTGVHPEPEVLGVAEIPARGPCLVACNHYSRPGLGAWWLPLTINAVVAAHRAADADREIHWVMTAAWTFPDSRWKRRLLTPLTRWAFARVAHVYGFVPMPPMPPDPGEVEARALAVRRTVRLARQLAPAGGMIGLAPEGQDTPDGAPGEPPPGAGSFIALLVQAGMPVLPVGVSEREGRLRLAFGPCFVPEIPAARAGRDRAVAQQVMAAIAGLTT